MLVVKPPRPPGTPPTMIQTKTPPIKPSTSKSYRSYVLLALTGVYTFGFIDRQILVILQESIKQDLQLSDTQLGLLTGLAFALFYVTLGIPIARLADKGNRVNIVAISLAVWSAMTALSGMAQNYLQLFMARLGVGVGEAGCSPPAHSIISDYYPPKKRATALAIYSLGIYIGILLGFMIGGWLNQVWGWRVAFYALGVPGILFALVIRLTVKEPPRGYSEKGYTEGTTAAEPQASFWSVVKTLFAKRTFTYLAIGTGIHAFALYGVGNFVPPFLARIHGMEPATIGLALGLILGVGGMIGTYLGGVLADKLGRRDIRWYLWLCAIAELFYILPSAFAYFSPNLYVVLASFFLATLTSAIYMGPCLGVTHNLIDPGKRALASAILFLILNAIGVGLGPLGIGLLSDYFSQFFGSESLRYAFCLSLVTPLIAMVFFYLAAKHYPEEVRE